MTLIKKKMINEQYLFLGQSFTNAVIKYDENDVGNFLFRLLGSPWFCGWWRHESGFL